MIEIPRRKSESKAAFFANMMPQRRQSMQELRTKESRWWRSAAFYYGLFFTVMCYAFLATAFGRNLLVHSPYDSYTLQALAWRNGHIALGKDYPWLELAIYQGRYYVSFPPFPVVPLWLLTFFFGGNTPNLLLNALLYVGSYSASFGIARRLRVAEGSAACFACFAVMGSGVLAGAHSGGVWHLAQGMSFFLTSLTVYGLLHSSRGWRFAAPVCLACAVGCRPLQAAFVPVVLFCLFQAEKRAGERVVQTLRRMVPYLVLPALIAVGYGVYNWVRFNNPLEFGHTYLPEFQRSEFGTFSAAYVAENIVSIFALPYFEKNRLDFPRFGFGFYLTNALYVIALLRLGERVVRKRRLQALDGALLVCVAVNFIATLHYKGCGGSQFGSRYLIDLLPFLYWFALRQCSRIRMGEGMIMAFGVLFNLYGTALFVLTTASYY